MENEGSKTGVFATLSGNGSGLGIVRDEARNSSVLNLPGGGLNQGCLTLPDNMFEDVTEEGFAFVAGAEDAKDLGNGQSGYHSSIMLTDRSAQLKLVWEEQFTHNAIGRSVYSTDNDLKAKVDEFRFYNTALTAEQAKAAYDSYAVSDSVLEELRGKVAEAEKKSVSFFTRESYEVLETALAEGKAGIENPVTEANVIRLTENLEQALGRLAYYEGISEETIFSDTQLTKETQEAQTLLSQGGLAEMSEQAISSAIRAAEQALAGEDKGRACGLQLCYFQ